MMKYLLIALLALITQACTLSPSVDVHGIPCVGYEDQEMQGAGEYEDPSIGEGCVQ